MHKHGARRHFSEQWVGGRVVFAVTVGSGVIYLNKEAATGFLLLLIQEFLSALSLCHVVGAQFCAMLARPSRRGWGPSTPGLSLTAWTLGHAGSLGKRRVQVYFM